MGRQKTARGVGRREGPRKERRVIAVFTEGQITEPEYVKALARRIRETTVVEIDPRHGRDPLDLVRMAVDKRTDGDADEWWDAQVRTCPQPSIVETVPPGPLVMVEGSLLELGMDRRLRPASGGPRSMPNYCEMYLIGLIGHASWNRHHQAKPGEAGHEEPGDLVLMMGMNSRICS